MAIFVVYFSFFEEETLAFIYCVLKYISGNHSYPQKDISMSRNDVDAVIGESSSRFR